MNFLRNKAWAIITARGGSKSIPLKNLVPVGGKPLIQYVIEAGKNAKHLERIFTSTDHEKIAMVASELGSEILNRPEDLSGDNAKSVDVMVDAVKYVIKKEGVFAEFVVLLQPTSLFVTYDQINSAIQALIDRPEAKSAQTVVEVPHLFHAYNMREMTPDGEDIDFVFKKERKKAINKQKKPNWYGPGNVIVTRAKALLEEQNLFARPSVPIVISRNSGYDLDTREDIEMAELLLQAKLAGV